MRGDNEWSVRAGISGLVLLLGAAPAMAQDGDALAACQLIEDSQERLECYDQVLKPREAPPAAPDAAEPKPQAEPAPVPAATPATEVAAQPAAEPSAATSVTVLDDEVGKESVSNDRTA